jgi:hypothetical protein
MHNLIWTGDHQSGRWCWRCTGAARVLQPGCRPCACPFIGGGLELSRVPRARGVLTSEGSAVLCPVVLPGTLNTRKLHSTVRRYCTSRRSRLQKGLSSHLIGLLSAHCEPRIRQCCPRPFNYVVCPPATSFLTTTARYAHTR